MRYTTNHLYGFYMMGAEESLGALKLMEMLA